jgi:DNA-directed DNA polymerase III PolC
MFLNTHTYYSLRYGTIAPKRLLTLAKELGVEAMAFTDINSTSASLELLRLAEKFKIKPVLGVDFRNGAHQEFILLAKNNKGFQLINSYLSCFLQQSDIEIPKRAKKMSDVFVIYPFEKKIDFELKPYEFIGVSKQDLETLKFLNSAHLFSKMVVLQTVSFEDKKGFNSHRLLRAIDNNTLLSKLPVSEQGDEFDKFFPLDTLKKKFSEYPKIIQNTEEILEECTVSFDFEEGDTNNQRCYTSNEILDYKLLEKLTYEGISYRFKIPNKAVLDRIKKELEIIRKKRFVSYFLINWKILKYARSKGYFYVGRGSGANSIVGYLLRITDVDPIELDLYFERFINLYRKSPPDFDLDFSWKDRDDITRFIFERFSNTALIAVYNTFKYKASVRELGKVFGLPKLEIDALCLKNYTFSKLDHLSRLVLIYSQYIQGFPNYLGIHAGGILISQKPIHYYVATFLPPKGHVTVQFDMVVAENSQLHKFDILSQRGLGKIKETVQIVTKNYPDQPLIDIHDIQRFKEDEKIKDLLRSAKTIGCFYVESPAMRMLLKKLQVDHYLGLVAASSVIRPGVSKSGMMREYILRYRFPEKRKKAHPIMLDIMPETYGIMVYQEDVIKVAHYFGGLSLGESDVLRRAMSGKSRSKEEFAKVKNQFLKNCLNSGKPSELVYEIWEQIESFAGYAFAKGHSASYTVESYQSLFLKAYYPLEYMVATINNYGGFYSTELYVHEARMHGGVIHAPCVNRGRDETSIDGRDIFIGFAFLHSLEVNTRTRILTARQDGVFENLDDFIERVPISIEQIRILIKINAFRFTGVNKRMLLWEAHMKIKKVVFEEPVATLFKTESLMYQTPKLPSSYLEDAFDQIELLGYPLSSPFSLLVENFSNSFRARDLIHFKGKTVCLDGYLVTVKNTKTNNGEYMSFGTFLDVDGDFLDTVHFPKVASKFPFRGKGIYKLKGKVVVEFDCVTIEVTSMKRLAIIEDPRYADSSKAERLKPKRVS